MLPSPEYRIVRDSYAGYEVQIRRWWLPIWMQPRSNTHATLAGAEAFAKKHAQGGVEKYLGRLPADLPQ